MGACDGRDALIDERVFIFGGCVWMSENGDERTEGRKKEKKKEEIPPDSYTILCH